MFFCDSAQSFSYFSRFFSVSVIYVFLLSGSVFSLMKLLIDVRFYSEFLPLCYVWSFGLVGFDGFFDTMLKIPEGRVVGFVSSI
jgi:hypothetical protein